MSKPDLHGSQEHKTLHQPTHTSHSRTRDFSRMAQDLSHRVNTNLCVSQTSRSHIKHSMSHAPSSLFPSHLSTTSLSTCTPVRLSTRPSLLSTSHGDLPCGSIECVFRPLAETRSTTDYEPKDLTEKDTSVSVTPMFFHRPSMTSTFDSAQSIATLPPE